MRRWHQDKRITRRHQWEHLKLVHNWPTEPVDCLCELQLGRFRKTGGRGCEIQNCMICRGDKILGVPTRQEKVAGVRFREQLAEVGR